MGLKGIYDLCKQPESVLNNGTFQALQCSGGFNATYAPCIICPNTDFAGVGVRAAFYVQSFFNTLLVIFSPEDSVPSAWAGTLLTVALILAAAVQKRNNQITLHHSTLVLNYATLSCISSLAIAPILPIWRLAPKEPVLRADHPHEAAPLVGNDDEPDVRRSREPKRQPVDRQRTVLALALLSQVVLQWAWGIAMFVSPAYSQIACSGSTGVLLFFIPLTADEINEKYFYVWAFWLLFSLGVTLALAIVLAVTSGTRAYAGLSRQSTVSSHASSVSIPAYRQFFNAAVASIPPWRDYRRQMIFWGNILSTSLWIAYIIQSELQIQANCIFTAEGENNFSGFGQITALLLALTPLWSLTLALYRYPSRLRKAERRRKALVQSLSVQEPSLAEAVQLARDDHDPSARVSLPHIVTQNLSPSTGSSPTYPRSPLRRRTVGDGSEIELQYLPGSLPSRL